MVVVEEGAARGGQNLCEMCAFDYADELVDAGCSSGATERICGAGIYRRDSILWKYVDPSQKHFSKYDGDDTFVEKIQGKKKKEKKKEKKNNNKKKKKRKKKERNKP